MSVHASAFVSSEASVGLGTVIWHGAQVRERAIIGAQCIIGKNVYVDFEVIIGDNVKVQNNSSLYNPLVLEDGVFVGPHVVFTNDRLPRAINPDGTRKVKADWEAARTRVQYGASVGAGAVVLPGVTIGQWALVGAGAIVTKDVPGHAIVLGNPASVVGYACVCGSRLHERVQGLTCPACGRMPLVATNQEKM